MDDPDGQPPGVGDSSNEIDEVAAVEIASSNFFAWFAVKQRGSIAARDNCRKTPKPLENKHFRIIANSERLHGPKGWFPSQVPLPQNLKKSLGGMIDLD